MGGTGIEMKKEEARNQYNKKETNKKKQCNKRKDKIKIDHINDH
jgi:hypothetical protein